MRFGIREGRAPDPQARRGGRGFRPGGEALEQRTLLTAIDLVNIATAPYGVEFAGSGAQGAAGFSSANVGDVNGDGLADFVVGAPTLNGASGGFPLPGLSAGSSAYLIFGSNVVPNTFQDWLALTPEQRIAALGDLGNQSQNSPVTGNPIPPFNGVQFVLPSFANPQLGASVAAAGDVNGDGFADFLIGAPNAADPNNNLNLGAGQAFLVYGSATIADIGSQAIDLGTPSTFAGQNIITFVAPAPNAQAGRGLAGVGDFIPDGIPDIAIGAPGSSLSGLGQSGAVFVISGTFLRPARSQVVDLHTVGQNGGVPGLIFTGERAGQGSGFSVATAGDVDDSGDSDLLIGAPDSFLGTPTGTTGPGSAYLVYGGTAPLNAPAVVNGFSQITLDRVSNPSAANAIPGARFVGAANGNLTGYSVSSTSDFNDDGFADFLFGSPGYDGLSGRADMILGSDTQVVGTITLDSAEADALGVQFFGANPGDLAGFAVGATASINGDNLPDAMIGAPGAINASGLVYLVPGNLDLLGAVSLDSASVQNSPAFATVIGLSQPVAGNFLGASIGGDPFGVATADSDVIPDFVLGAPGYALNQALAGAGAGFILEGAFIPLAIPVSSAIISPIGIERVRPPFIISATTPADLEIFILSAGSNTPGFEPANDLDPTTITVNGVALPDPSTFTNVGDLDGDGIDDAGFIFSPRSLLGLTTATTLITVQARTLDSSPFPNQRYSGTAPVTVVAGPGPGGGGFPSINAGFGAAFQNANAAAPRFGERFLPSLPVIGRPQWKPLPSALAYRQFLPTGPFGHRLRNFFHPGFIGRDSAPPRARTFPNAVFRRGKFPKGVHFGRIRHDGFTIGGPLIGPFGYFHGQGRN